MTTAGAWRSLMTDPLLCLFCPRIAYLCVYYAKNRLRKAPANGEERMNGGNAQARPARNPFFCGPKCGERQQSAIGRMRARVRGAVGRGGVRGRGEPRAAVTGVLRALLRGAGKTVRVAAIGADRLGRVFLLERRRAMMTARREKRPLYGLGNVRGNGRRGAEGESGAGRRPGRRGAGASAPGIRPNPPNADGRAEKRFPCAPVRGWTGRAPARAFGDSPAPRRR